MENTYLQQVLQVLSKEEWRDFGDFVASPYFNKNEKFVRFYPFGAFHGKFKAPTGTLTGGMRLEEAHGSAYVHVEEYKRATFEVVFDPLAGTPKLGEAVTVTGTAKSYAGVPLDGATVRWKVDRGARMPWWCWGWRGLPWGRSTEVASGTTVCDAQGRFTVTFQAEADRAFPRQADPTFNFTLSADATDITGETQSGSTSFSLAYRSIDIELLVGEALDRANTDSIVEKVKNLNGEDVDVPMDVRIVELVPPVDAPRRDRLWERPDRILEGELPTTHTLTRELRGFDLTQRTALAKTTRHQNGP